MMRPAAVSPQSWRQLFCVLFAPSAAYNAGSRRDADADKTAEHKGVGHLRGVLRRFVLYDCAAGLCRQDCAGGLLAGTGAADAGRLLPTGDEWMARLGRLRLADPLTGEETFHRGTDLACAEGTRVLAVMDGVVSAARRSTTYGNYLRLSHSGGQETLYAHLQYLFVRAGEVVQAGQPLGTAGETGRSTGTHLHFELLEQGTRYDAGALLGLP